MFPITGYEFSLLAGNPEPDRAGVRHPAPGPQELPPHRLKGQARPLPTLAFQLSASSPCLLRFSSRSEWSEMEFFFCYVVRCCSLWSLPVMWTISVMCYWSVNCKEDLPYYRYGTNVLDSHSFKTDPDPAKNPDADPRPGSNLTIRSLLSLMWSQSYTERNEKDEFWRRASNH